MQYKGKITISPEMSAKVDNWLNGTPIDEDDFNDNFLGEDETHTETFVFPDGKIMDIKVCGVSYEEDGYNNAWTEAVLFDPNGSQISFTEPNEAYIGEWKLEDSETGNTYTVEIVKG